MHASMRTWTGGILTAVGAVAWAWTLTMLEPAVHRSDEAVKAAVRVPSADDVAQMMLMAKDLRWAALVLTVGGLLILLTARAMVVLGGVLWLATDIVLDRLDVEGWIPLALSLAGLLAIVVLAWRRSRGEAQTPSSATVLVYSGVAAALAPLMFFVSPDVSAYRPAGMLAVGAVVSLGLAVVAVAVALTAVARPVPGLALRAMALACLVVSPSIAAQLWFATGEVAQNEEMFLVWVAAPILLLGCILLVKGRPRGWRWLGFSGLAIVLSAASYVFLYLGILVSYSLQYQIVPLTGDRAFFDGYQFSVAGFGTGLLLGGIALAAPRGAPTTRAVIPVLE